MIKIRKFKEEWVDGLKIKPDQWNDLSYYEIFKNPSKKELNDSDGYDTRGVILKNGDFYIVSPSEELIHVSLLKILSTIKIITTKWIDDDWGKDGDSLTEFLCVERAGDSFDFYQSESYFIKIMPSLFEEYKINFKKNNPSYTLFIRSERVFNLND